MRTTANLNDRIWELDYSCEWNSNNAAFIYLASRRVGAHEIHFILSLFLLGCIQLKSKKFTKIRAEHLTLRN